MKASASVSVSVSVLVSASAPPALQASSLSLARGGRTVLEGVSLSLRAGHWVALVGPNGAGKSSLLEGLAGLLKPTGGEVQLLGRSLREWPARELARRLVWLGQRGEIEGDLAAVDIVRLARLPHHGLFGSASAADEAAVQSAMSATECGAFAARPLNALSGVERQRVLLARALAGDPQVLLLDEPATHLDLPHQRALLRLLAAEAARGTAVVSVLHDLTAALAADRVLVLAGGRLVADGVPGEPVLHRALVQAFGGALSIEPIDTPSAGNTPARRRWVALPTL